MKRGQVPEQLPLDFNASASMRLRRARKAAPDVGPPLFLEIPNLDVHLHSTTEASAQIAGKDPDATQRWLVSVVGPVQSLRARRVTFAAANLDRLLHVRPPAQVTLDAATLAIARALWARSLGLRPLHVTRHQGRLRAASVRWPRGFGVKDVPWSAIAALHQMGLQLDVDPTAKSLYLARLAASGQHIATAGLAGSAVLLQTDRPSLLESLDLPALAYVGDPESGFYRLPLLLSKVLLENPAISVPADLAATITRLAIPPRALSTPIGFPWTLFPFQASDAARAVRILEVTGGVLLAGDMGSGKTTITLALLEHLGLWPALIVGPLASFSTWERQLTEMGRSHLTATGSLKNVWATMEAGGLDATIVAYDRVHALIELVERGGFKAIVADEIQRIRTPSSRRSRALRQLAQAAPYRIGLTGTPLQNRLDDLLPLGAFLAPGEWKPRASAKDLADVYPGEDPARAVADHLGSMMVRRRMEDTGVQLPAKNVHRVHVPLSGDQQAALLALQEEAKADQKTAGGDGTQRMHVFAKLQRMRQVISCPQLANVPGPNPKITAALDLVEQYNDAGRKGIVFCVHRRTWQDLHEHLNRRGLQTTGIWGSSSLPERRHAERTFHADPKTRVFIGTLASCAESLTLSPTATYCIFVDLSYSPADLAQAEARAYRMNTTKEVDVTYLHATAPGGTLDDRMVQLLTIKRSLFAKIVDRDDAWTDPAALHYSLQDLVFLLTGEAPPAGVAALEAPPDPEAARTVAALNEEESDAAAQQILAIRNGAVTV